MAKEPTTAQRAGADLSAAGAGNEETPEGAAQEAVAADAVDMAAFFCNDTN